MFTAGAVMVSVAVHTGLDIAQRSSREGHLAAARALARNIEIHFDFAEQLITAGAKRPGLVRFLAAGDLEGVQRVVDVIYNQTPYYHSVVVVNRDLQPQGSAPAVPAGDGFDSMLQTTLAAGIGQISPPMAGSTGNRLVIVVTEVVRANDGRLLGVLAGEISFPKIAADLLDFTYGRRGYGRLISRDGRILADPNATPGTVGDSEFISSYAATASLTPEMRYRCADGTEMIAAVVPATGQGWLVAVVQPASEAADRVDDLRLLMLILLVGEVLIASIFGYLLMNNVTGPIASVAEVAGRISGGELDVRMPRSRFREIEVVNAAINRMADTLTALLKDLENANCTLERRVEERTSELQRRNEEILHINRKLDANVQELRETQQQLVEASHRAGMAEVASDLLHKSGNTLNSITVSVSMIQKQIHSSALPMLLKAIDMMLDHRDDLSGFFAENPRGQLLPTYIAAMRERTDQTLRTMSDEIDALREHLANLEKIVAVHRSYARHVSVTEQLPPHTLVDQVIEYFQDRLTKHHIAVICDYQDTGLVAVDRHRVVQIVWHLFSNALQALTGVQADRVIKVSVDCRDDACLYIRVADNGCGIPPDQLTSIFQYGVTSKTTGDGVGLHTSATKAMEMGGSLTCTSGGSGQGATFTLAVPLHGDAPQ